MEVVRRVLRLRVPAARLEEHMGDLAELWARRGSSHQRARTLRALRDIAGFLWHTNTATRNRHARGSLWTRVTHGLGALWHDGRYAFRLMRRQPLVSTLTLVTLTLGISASTGIFSTVDRLLWRPLPFPHPQQLAIVIDPLFSFADNRMAPSRQMAALPVFDGIGLYAEGGVNVEGLGVPVRANATVASPGFFSALAVPALMGHTYTQEEDVPGANAVVVVSHRFWRQYLGGDVTALTRPLVINRRPFRITGVMPESFTFPGATDVWLPSGTDHQVTGQSLAPTVIARIATGIPWADVDAALVALEHELGAPEPNPNEATKSRLVGLQETLTTDVRPTLLLLAISVGLVLLVAATNVAGLFLARVSRRQPEFALRLALGSGRWRLLQLMATDAACYAAVAGVAGTLLSVVAIRAFTALGDPSWAAADASTVDGRVLVIAVAVSAVGALVFGLAPGLAAWAQPSARALRSGATATPGRRWRWVRHGLVVGQVAAALVLLSVATATTGTMRRLAGIDLAFDGRGVVGLDVTLPDATYEQAPARMRFAEQALARLSALPGVLSVGATNRLPGDRSVGVGNQLRLPGEVRAADTPPLFFLQLSASPGYFDAMGTPVVEGRSFTTGDREGTPPVAIISESTARRLWPDGRSPIGLRIETGFRTAVSLEVVGVVPDVRLSGPQVTSPALHVYTPIAQGAQFGALSFAVKTTGDPLAIASAVRSAVADVDASLPVYNIHSMEQVAHDFLSAQRLATALMGGFALVTLVLAGIGIYGVLAQFIEQQTREIGIRVALGADPYRVRRTVTALALRLAGTGVALGAAASGLAATLVASYVPRLDQVSWTTVAVHAGVLFGLAIIAAWIPARRASAIDPIRALRDC